MKKLMILVLTVILVSGTLLITGCGGGSSDDSNTSVDEDVIDVTEPVSEGIYGDYEQTNGDKTISFYNDGTFATGTGDEGAFEIESENSLELTYEDGKKETWSVMIAAGEIAAVADPDGEQYDKK